MVSWSFYYEIYDEKIWVLHWLLYMYKFLSFTAWKGRCRKGQTHQRTQRKNDAVRNGTSLQFALQFGVSIIVLEWFCTSVWSEPKQKLKLCIKKWALRFQFAFYSIVALFVSLYHVFSALKRPLKIMKICTWSDFIMVYAGSRNLRISCSVYQFMFLLLVCNKQL